MLLPRLRSSQVYLPLALFFFINGTTELASLVADPRVIELHPYWPRLLLFLSFPLHAALAPLFWIYIRGITSDKLNLWCQKDALHFVLSTLALAIPILAIMIGPKEFLALFEQPRISTSASQWWLIALIKTLETLIILQVTIYIGLTLLRLRHYQKALVQLFASTEHLELRWLRSLAIFLLLYLCVSAASSLADKPILFEPWESALDLILLWFLVVWGLRQKPGLAHEVAATYKKSGGIEKYQKSALSAEQLKSIALRVGTAMQDDKLYQTSDLSLRVLADHIKELPNYVSQALNQEIGESFFDYVNQWRVKDAEQKLASSSLTVLAIAEEVGFNSRSSFYNAFKKSTGQTPSAYRKAIKKVA